MGDILWLDNDPLYIQPYASALIDQKHDVTVVTSVFDAEAAIRRCRFDLLILDVMIPTMSEDEERAYDPAETERGLKTGLVFYRRNKRDLDTAQTQLLVLTVRLDRAIFDEFTAAGLPGQSFMTKMSLREAPVFVSKVEELLSKSKRPPHTLQ